MTEVTNDFAEFDPQVRVGVEGLLYLGHLTESFEFCGHTFTLRTLKAHEELAAAQACEPFTNTLKAPDAWMSAQVGLALEEVDYEDDFCPQAGPDEVAFARARFQYVTRNWYWPTIHFLYQSYVTLQEKQLAAIRALQDLSQGSPHSSSDLGGSFEPRDILTDEMLAEIQRGQS